MSRCLVAGCGYVGTALAERLAREGHEVFGLRRSDARLPSAIRFVLADLGDPSSLAGLPERLDYVFYTASAGGGGEPAYRAAYVEGLRNLLDALPRRSPAVRRVLFTSSTSVYEQSGGEWVDEESETRPSHFSGRLLLEAERTLRESSLPGISVRLAGIYGPGRTRLVEQVRSGRAVVSEAPVFTNRIHRDDCAGVLHHLMEQTEPHDLYLGVDCEPAERGEVLRWLAARLGVADPPRGESAGEPGRRARSNKRCRNARLLASGYRFRFPSFRDGYAGFLAPPPARR